MALRELFAAFSMIAAASPLAANQPEPAPPTVAPAGGPETRYCMRVELTGTNVTREGILKLQELPKLWLVAVSRDRFTEEDVRMLSARMPRVQFRREEEPFPNE